MNSHPMQLQYIQKQKDNSYMMSTNPIKPSQATSTTIGRLESGEDRAQLFLQRLFHQQAAETNQPQTSPAFINTFYMLAPPGFAALGNYASKSNLHPHFNPSYDRSSLLPSPVLPYTYASNTIEYGANEAKQYEQRHQPMMVKNNNVEPDVKRENGDNTPNNFIKLRTTCDRCISLKAKCLRMKDTNKCARCFRGNHVCNFSAQKKRGRVAKYDQLMMSIGSKRETPDSPSISQDGSHEESDRDQEPSSSSKRMRNDC